MLPGDKRQHGDSPPPEGSSTELVAVAAKKPRCDGALISAPGGGGTLSVPGGSVPRTSDLAAPIMRLSGHVGEVLSARFSPCGSFLATAGFDKEVLLWQVFGDCRNYCALRSHSKAVLQLCWGVDSSLLYSCAADKTVIAWDAEYGERSARLTGHTSHVNSVAAAREARGMIASGCARARTATGSGRAAPPRRRVLSVPCMPACPLNVAPTAARRRPPAPLAQVERLHVPAVGRARPLKRSHDQHAVPDAGRRARSRRGAAVRRWAGQRGARVRHAQSRGRGERAAHFGGTRGLHHR